MFDIDTFYPTPKALVEKMISLIQGDPDNILEPSAGKGDITDGLKGVWTPSRGFSGGYKYSDANVSAIEIDETLQATLRGKGVKVIDTDFLNFSGQDKFDLIIANPPFNEGDKHLLKAIDIMYRGEIIFLLNAETIKNPCTNSRKELLKRLDELDAKVEYLYEAFKDAEHPTLVEVALVYIKIDRDIEDDLFAGTDDKVQDQEHRFEDRNELSTGKTIPELVAEYNQIIDIGAETIKEYHRNYKKVGGYLHLTGSKEMNLRKADITSRMQYLLNDLIKSVRIDYWRRTLDLKEVKDRLTSKKRNEFEAQLQQRFNMDFTESNIRQFVLNLIGGYQKTLEEAVVDTFDKFTKYGYNDKNLYEENIHYFNGWKTNSAFKVNRRIVLPIYGAYGDGPFTGYRGEWKLNRHSTIQELDDIDMVMNYFDGMRPYLPMSQAIQSAFLCDQNTKIRSTYFTVNCYKKGTIHLTFNDDDILRRFNVVACKGKNWLPCDYGAKSYAELTGEEKAVVDAFEGVESYALNRNAAMLAASPQLRLTA